MRGIPPLVYLRLPSVEMAIERISLGLYFSLGVFLPLITVNCAILGTSLFMVARNYGVLHSAVFGLGSGLGCGSAFAALASAFAAFSLFFFVFAFSVIRFPLVPFQVFPRFSHRTRSQPLPDGRAPTFGSASWNGTNTNAFHLVTIEQ